jgi:cytochrome c oxidase subunit 2
MKRSRVGLLAVFGVALLAAVTDPAAAQASRSTTAEAIWGLNRWLLLAGVTIAVLTEGILIYTVLKYRKNDEAKPTLENRRLEITWTVATALILLLVGVFSYSVMANPYVSETADRTAGLEEEPEEIKVIGQRYSWTFEYPESGVTTSNTLVLPKDRPVRLNVTSTDWLHAFHVPALGLKQDAMPGQSNYIVTKPTEAGTYQLYCAEYCGSGHSKMLGEVEVKNQTAYEDWLESQQ